MRKRFGVQRGGVGGLTVLLLALSCGGSRSVEPEFQAFRNLDYVPDQEYSERKDLLDVFAPVGAGRLPVLIFLHGGGLVDGDKSFSNYSRPGQPVIEDFVPRRFTPEGIVVVLANYRLSPAVMHPEHARDAARVVGWVRRNIQRYGGDPDRIFLSGHSAGAYLAALLGTDPSYLDAEGLPLQALSGVIPVSAFIYVPEVAPDRPKTVWGEDPVTWEQASVGTHVGAGKSPFLLLFADGDEDWRKEQNRRFQQEMLKHGNPVVELQEIGGRDHISIWSRILEPGDAASRAIVDFIHRPE